MDKNHSKDYLKSNIQIVEFAFKKWKTLLGVAIFAGIFGVIFSGPDFIEPEYKSESIIYPANLGEYSSETGLEQIQQYLESNSIRDSIIRKFNLYDEYKIDKSVKSAKAYMKEAYAEHVSFNETRFESVNIEVYSTDPEKSKKMVDEIIHQLNNDIRRTQKEKYQENVIITKKLVDEKKEQIDSLQKLIQTYSMKYGLLDYETQSERVTEKYLDFLLAGKKGKDFEEVKKLYDNLKKYGQYFQSLHELLEESNLEYLDRLKEYELYVKDVNKTQTYSYVLVNPEVADKKSSPIRWLIIASAIAAAVGFTFALLLILGFQKR